MAVKAVTVCRPEKAASRRQDETDQVEGRGQGEEKGREGKSQVREEADEEG